MTKADILITLFDYDRTALKAFMDEQGSELSEAEAIRFILDDWLIAHGYQPHHSDGLEYEE